MGTIPDIIATYVVFFVVAAFGVFVACYMMKTQLVKTGIATIVLEFGFIVILFALLIAAFTFLGEGDFSESISPAAAPSIIRLLLPVVLFILTGIAGTILGIFTGAHLLKKISAGDDLGHVTSNESVVDYLNFYLARKGRSFFSIIILCTGISLFVASFDVVFLYLRWAIIGPIYVLVHPALWGAFFLGFIAMPYEVLYGIVPPLSVLCPLLYLHANYKIARLHIHKVYRILIMIVAFFAIYPISLTLIEIAKSPMGGMVEGAASRGQVVWGVLLDKYTRPYAYVGRYEYLMENEKEDEAVAAKDQAMEAYFDSAILFIRSENLDKAKSYFEEMLKLSGKDNEWIGRIALAYYDFEIYGEVINFLEPIQKESGLPLELKYLLYDSYIETYDDQQALDILKQIYEKHRDVLSEEEKMEVMDLIEALEEDLGAQSDNATHKEAGELQ